MVGTASELAFTFTDADSGRPLADLQPYLAAAGHVVVMRADGETFAHEHAEMEDADGDPVFALPGQRFGPRLDVHTTFHTPWPLPTLGAVPAGRRPGDHGAVHRGRSVMTRNPLPHDTPMGYAVMSGRHRTYETRVTDHER